MEAKRIAKKSRQIWKQKRIAKKVQKDMNATKKEIAKEEYDGGFSICISNT